MFFAISIIQTILNAMILPIALIILTIFKCTIQNLIINGDFQFYSRLFNNSQTYINVTSDPSIWYVKNTNFNIFQVKILPRLNTTYCVDLSSVEPTTLCQNVNVSIGSRYTLSYSLFSDRFTGMSGKVFINDILATEVFIPEKNTFKTQLYTFYAQRHNNSICFNQTHETNHIGLGGVLDNISLVLINQQTIMFNYSINQLQAIIILQSNISYNQYMSNHFKNTQTIQLQQKTIDYQITKSANEKMQIQILFNFTFNENTIRLLSTYRINQTNYKILFATPFKDKYYYFLNQNQALLMSRSKDTLISVNQAIGKVSTLSRVFFVSYFISCIIDVHFLSLFYIFTQPQLMPQFAKDIYHEILNIIFQTQGTPQFMIRMLGISSNTLSISIQDTIPERIQEQKNEQPWFGTYGLSSRLAKSNIANILTLGLIIIKFRIGKFILYIIRRLVPDSIRKHFRMNSNIYVLLLTQFCFMTPIIVVSTLANIISSVNNIIQKIYIILSLALLSFIIGCSVIYMFLPSFMKSQENLQEKKLLRSKKIKKKPKKGQKKMILRYKCDINSGAKYSQDAFIIPLLFFIPFGIYFDVRFFFVVNGLLILLRLFALFKLKTERVSKIQNILNFANILVWITHHLSFLLLWQFKKEQMNEELLKSVSQLGLIVIFTALIMFMLQIFKLIIMMTKTIVEIFKFMIKLRKDYKQAQIKQKILKKLKKQRKQKLKNLKKIKQQIALVIIDNENVSVVQKQLSYKEAKEELKQYEQRQKKKRMTKTQKVLRFDNFLMVQNQKKQSFNKHNKNLSGKQIHKKRQFF